MTKRRRFAQVAAVLVVVTLILVVFKFTAHPAIEFVDETTQGQRGEIAAISLATLGVVALFGGFQGRHH